MTIEDGFDFINYNRELDFLYSFKDEFYKKLPRVLRNSILKLQFELESITGKAKGAGFVKVPSFSRVSDVDVSYSDCLDGFNFFILLESEQRLERELIHIDSLFKFFNIKCVFLDKVLKMYRDFKTPKVHGLQDTVRSDVSNLVDERINPDEFDRGDITPVDDSIRIRASRMSEPTSTDVDFEDNWCS